MLPHDFGEFVMRGDFGAHRLKLSHVHIAVSAAPEGGDKSAAHFQNTVALIDSGASHCLVSPAFAEIIGARVVDVGGKYIAAGKTDGKAKETRIVVAVTGGSKTIAREFQSGVLPLPSELQCVLGMDMLCDGVLSFDGFTGWWTWRLQRPNAWTPASMVANFG